MRDLSKRLTYTVEEAGRLLGVGRNQAYDAAKRGEVPTIRVGKRLLVPKAALDRLLGVGEPGGQPLPPGGVESTVRATPTRGAAPGKASAVAQKKIAPRRATASDQTSLSPRQPARRR